MEAKLTIRTLSEDNQKDIERVSEMDELSNYYIIGWLESDMAYGLFEGEKLIGYLTLGYADDCGDLIENHPDYSSDSRMLSNVYIRNEYRGKKLGLTFISEVLIEVDESIYLDFLHDRLADYYKEIGFIELGGNSMYLNPRNMEYCKISKAS